MENIIEINNITKTYKTKQKSNKNEKLLTFNALENVSFNVSKGEIFGLLGQNGAGKSTLLKILTTMSLPTKGEIKISGEDVVQNPTEVRKQFGILFQNETLDVKLSAYWNIKYQAQLYGVDKKDIEERIEWTINMMDLQKHKDVPIGKLSGGLRRRVELARSLVSKPKILFLDEPTTGVDPQNRSKIWEHVVNLTKELEMTIFLTTHYMEEAEICDRIGILVNGKLKELDKTKDLKEKFSKSKIIVNIENGLKDIELLKAKLPKNFEIKKENNQAIILVNKIKLSDIVIISKLLKIDIDSIEYIEAKVQDAFLNIVDSQEDKNGKQTTT